MRIVFAGSPDIAVPTLEALAEEFEVVGVLTNPDRRKGRSKKLLPTEVKSKALELGLPVFQYDHLYGEARTAIAALEPDILISFAFGKIFGPKFLALFPEGGVNVHPSLLPLHRGATPIPAAILAGDPVTGITVQKISLKMDEGDILDTISFPLDGSETTESLSTDVSVKSPKLLCDVIRTIERDTAIPLKQDDTHASYCSFMQKSDAEIDWNSSATQISGMVRGYYPWPKAFTRFQGKVLMLTYAREITEEISEISIASDTQVGTVLGTVAKQGILITTGKGIVSVERLQLQSKKELDWKAFMNGNPSLIGSVLGE